MFTNLIKIDFIEKLESQAIETNIKESWDKFAYLFDVIEQYISNNELIISDIKMVLNEKELYKEKYIIYCNNPFKYANNLTNILAEKICCKEKNDNGKWIQLRTSIQYKQLSILYKNIELVDINCITNNVVNIKTIVQYVTRKGFYTENLLHLLPPEIELINIYKKLYSPNFVSDWKYLIEIEPLLIKNAKSNNESDKSYISDKETRLKSTFSDISLQKEKKKVKKNITGGNSNIIKNPIVYSKFRNTETLKYIIILKILSDLDYVLIGPWAINLIEMGLYGKKMRQSREKIQLITQDSIKDTFQTLKERIKKVFSDYMYEITYREHDLCLPKEYRAKRYTIYVKEPCTSEGLCPVREKPIIDIFINGTYELIPWISANRFLKRKNKHYPKNIRIGNPYVLLRFLLIDLWIIRVLYMRGIMLKNIYDIKIKNIWIMVLKIRNKNKLGGIINKAFSLEHYIGVYSNEYIYFKNLVKNKSVPFYNPVTYKKEHGSYRDI